MVFWNIKDDTSLNLLKELIFPDERANFHQYQILCFIFNKKILKKFFCLLFQQGSEFEGSPDTDKKSGQKNPEKSVQIIFIIYTIFPRNIRNLNQNFIKYFEGGNLTQFSRGSLWNFSKKKKFRQGGGGEIFCRPTF